MSRHSQHCNDRSYYSYKERADAGYGKSKKDILGTDCFLPFGYCCLSLKPAKDPVATPDGFIFDREFILESLLTQKIELQQKAKKYEEQERKKDRQELSEKRKEQLKEIEDFQKADQGLLSSDARHKRALERSDRRVPGAPDDEGPAKRLRDGELLVVDKAKQREKSFWAKETTPNAAPTELTKVDTATRCPMSGKKLKVKDLIPVKFEILDQKTFDSGGGRGFVCCPVSKHSIAHEPVVLLKPSGWVMLESILKDIVYPEMKCPVTGIKLKGKEDVMKLQKGGTGFAAHNKNTAKVWSAIRSRTGDDLRHQGHLPKAGYVGLV
uniref:Nitric oxide synthase-interacting protein zinc-finger domain-containing protein n=1 Tax=Alexandrium catenella TaxID=2925 RepID=A0A7S1RYV0_ALECA